MVDHEMFGACVYVFVLNTRPTPYYSWIFRHKANIIEIRGSKYIRHKADIGIFAIRQLPLRERSMQYEINIFLLLEKPQISIAAIANFVMHAQPNAVDTHFH